MTGVVGTLGEKLAADYILEELAKSIPFSFFPLYSFRTLFYPPIPRIQGQAIQLGSEMSLDFGIQTVSGAHRFDFVGKIPVKM